MVLFDRSWYNRAGVERVMGFCTPEEHARFLDQAPVFEKMLVEDGIILLKYWFSVSDEEQQRRFQARIDDPLKRWKLSPMDLESMRRWEDYSRAKDEMFARTDIPESPWHVVESDIKRNARIDCITHLLSRIPYERGDDEEMVLPTREPGNGYVRPPRQPRRRVASQAHGLIERFKARKENKRRDREAGEEAREIADRAGFHHSGQPDDE